MDVYNKKARIALILLGLIVSTISFAGVTAGPKSFVNLNKYTGKWYEVASYPIALQRGCSCVTADYKFVDKDKMFKVKNTCKREMLGDKLHTIHGTAELNSLKENKFTIKYKWPFKIEHWILFVDTSYKYAIIGLPGTKHFWIFSRTPTISKSVQKRLYRIAKKKGLDVAKASTTIQNCGL